MMSELAMKLVAAAFILAIFAVYGITAWLSYRAIRRRRARAPVSPRERRARLLFYPLAILGLACMAYARFVEPWWLEVTHVRIASPKFPPGAGPVRIVFISDLHSEAAPRLEERLPDVIAAEKPDLIFYTGDSNNSPEGIPTFQRCLARLSAIAPTFVVKGNMDRRRWNGVNHFVGTGVRELSCDAVTRTVRGVPLWIGGVERTRQVESLLADSPSDVFRILLCHKPSGADAAETAGADLTCCGHTHGGQVALPFYGALLTASSCSKRFESGLYRVNAMWLYVTRGIGMEGLGLPRVRFLARPEVTVIELVPSPL